MPSGAFAPDGTLAQGEDRLAVTGLVANAPHHS